MAEPAHDKDRISPKTPEAPASKGTRRIDHTPDPRLSARLKEEYPLTPSGTPMSLLRASRLAAKLGGDEGLQRRAAERAGLRGDTYEVKSVLTPHDRVLILAEEVAERARLRYDEKERALRAREARRSAREQEKAAAHRAVAERKLSRKPAAKLARQITPALKAAVTLDEEILALVAGLDERKVSLVLRRWGYAVWPPAKLEALGAEYGVTRERVRQIVRAHDEKLRGLGPLLPLARRAVVALTDRGGMLSMAAFESALETDGVSATPAALRSLAALHEIGLVPPIAWDAKSDMWLDERYFSAVQDGSLAAARSKFLVNARRALQRSGAISLTRVTRAAPIPADHALRLLLGSTPYDQIAGYIVPRIQRDSRMSRRVREMVTVSPGLTIDTIRRGLRRISPRPIRLPHPVIRAVLDYHPAFRLEGGAVYMERPVSIDDILYPADTTLIRAMQSRGGRMNFAEIKALFSSAKIPSGYFLRAAHVGWLVSIQGNFLLRGHPAAAGITTEGHVAGTPRPPRSRVYVMQLWPDEDTAIVRYRVIPSSLRGGLRIPKRVAARAACETTPWSILAEPSLQRGSQVSIAVDGESLWDIRPWLLAAGAVTGQHIAVQFSFATRTVQLSLIEAEQAQLDEARWVAERIPAVRRYPVDPTRRRERRERVSRRPAVVTVKEFGDYFDVPNTETDLSSIRFQRVQRVPSPESDLLIAALPDFPLAPGTSGVTMALIFQLAAGQGQRKVYSDLLETRMLDRAPVITHAEASLLVRNLDRHLVRGRLALAWREYRPDAEVASTIPLATVDTPE